MENKEFIDHLQQLNGQIGALTMALRGLILVQPDPYVAAMEAQRQIEKYLASAIGQQVSDAYLSGIERGRKDLFPEPPTPSPCTQR